jgi:hypothetical protein
MRPPPRVPNPALGLKPTRPRYDAGTAERSTTSRGSVPSGLLEQQLLDLDLRLDSLPRRTVQHADAGGVGLRSNSTDITHCVPDSLCIWGFDHWQLCVNA